MLAAATKVHYRWSGRERGNAHGRRGVWGGLAPIPRCGWEEEGGSSVLQPTCFQVRFFKPWFGRRAEEVFSQDMDDAYMKENIDEKDDKRMIRAEPSLQVIAPATKDYERSQNLDHISRPCGVFVWQQNIYLLSKYGVSTPTNTNTQIQYVL